MNTAFIRIALVTLLVGCAGLSDEEVQRTSSAERLFKDSVLPVFETSCIGCHNDPTAGSGYVVGPAFLAGNSPQQIRQTLLDSDVIANELHQSLLLTKGAHSGPNLTNAESTLILRWLEAEHQ